MHCFMFAFIIKSQYNPFKVVVVMWKNIWEIFLNAPKNVKYYDVICFQIAMKSHMFSAHIYALESAHINLLA